jgi:hypothetical protein
LLLRHYLPSQTKTVITTGIVHVDTGKVELVTVDKTGVVLEIIVDNWVSYIPNEP